MNKVILIGNLTRDPELTQTTSGISVCRFGIAVQRRFTSANGEREADFLNVTVWRNQAENCHKYLKKGAKVSVVGSIQTNSYEKDGQKRYTTDIVADEVGFLSTKSSDDGEGKVRDESVTELKPVDDDTLPF